MSWRLSGASPGAIPFFALLALALVAAVLVVRARTPDLVLEVEPIKPREVVVQALEPEPAEITFFVRESDSAAEVSIVDAEGDVVRTLASAVALEADRRTTYRWDGTDDGGRPVKTGHYRLRVDLDDSDLEMIWPRRISVDRSGAP